MSERVDDIGRAFCGFFEAKKIRVRQVTKFDVIEEIPDIYQVIYVLNKVYPKYRVDQGFSTCTCSNSSNCFSF